MLQEAIDLQNRAVEELLDVTPLRDEITFKAPTGSGKTYMMAKYMNRILEKEKDVVFLVTTLSKANLAKQNNEKFEEYSKNEFKNLKPYLINTEASGEETLHIVIDDEINVYSLQTGLTGKNSLLQRGPLINFLSTLTLSDVFGGKNKKIYLIKDECHIATSRIDGFSEEFFSKTINISATPNLGRGQVPDVEITENDAINAKLIKALEVGDEKASFEDAIKTFKEIKKDYINLLGVNPCMIVQISNKQLAEEELNNIIYPALHKNTDIKWMIITNDLKQCDSNDDIKNKLSPTKWKEIAKGNNSVIDVIIFKLAITEGWDIPRACMLYQIRDVKSKQLDEQVLGRIRRNPRLLEYETLPAKAQDLATKAWVWGMLPDDAQKIRQVNLKEKNDTKKEINIKTTSLKPLKKKSGFNVNNYLKGIDSQITPLSIFNLYKDYVDSDSDIKRLVDEYSTSYTKWFDFLNNIKTIISEHRKYVCNYEDSMEITKGEDGNELLVSLPDTSSYAESELSPNYLNISDWVWKRKDDGEKFSFDSSAEKEWAEILKDLASKETRDNPSKRVIKRIKDSDNEIFLWGKNYPIGSDIKFEYYLEGNHFSYPDFILKDSFDRIHFFEVKSVNISKNNPATFNRAEYERKINELIKCYKQASLLTGYYFYLPIQDGDSWKITKLDHGIESQITKNQFIDFIREK